jgi:2-amino-4-hydroxy-6-hydroxymethyldihydropteridine diphosphokinase
MRQEVTAYVALGANLGDALQSVRQAITRLGELPETRLVRASSLYRTAPVASGGPDYINAVAELSTRLSAPRLLAELQRLETEAGRQRPFTNAPRTLDLDLLLFGQARIWSMALTVPHPRMGQRAFVLVPLAEIAPRLVAPEQLKAVGEQAIAQVAPAPKR